MKPLEPEDRNEQSSDSDEDNNVRHDRFRSERFQEANSRNLGANSDKIKSCDSHRNKRYKDESPLRNSKHKERISSTSSHREESRSNHESRDGYKSHCSKYRKVNRHERSVQKKNHSKVNECENDNLVQTSKMKLSSLLKNFDKKVEEKRNNLEQPLETGSLNFEQECHDREVSDDSTAGESPIGPILPPFLRNVGENETGHFGKCGSNSPNDMTAFGVVLPPHLEMEGIKDCDEGNAKNETVSTIDPPHIKSSQVCEKNNLEMSSSSVIVKKMDVQISAEPDIFGPALPPKTEKEVYGPLLPPKVETDSYGPALPPNFKKSVIQGPSLPSEGTLDQIEIKQEVSEDEDVVGPLPEGQMNMTQYQLDLRAMHIKKQLEEEKSGSSKDIKKREEWMLELPPEKATNLGLGPRSFRMKEAPDMSNRSSWTDTPADKMRKEEMALRGEAEPVNSEEMMKSAFVRERDEAMDKMSQLIRDEDRPQSLLELHQKKLKKKKKKEKKEGKKKERRPFDRNIDLQVNRFDEAQKKAIFKKAQLLDTRFSTGESKYL